MSHSLKWRMILTARCTQTASATMSSSRVAVEESCPPKCANRRLMTVFVLANWAKAAGGSLVMGDKSKRFRPAQPDRRCNLFFLRSLRPAFFLNRGLRGGEAGDRHAERRAAHITQTEFVAEFHGVGVAAVFA